MKKTKVFLTGATGNMGQAVLRRFLREPEKHDLTILARPSEKNKKLLRGYEGAEGLHIVWGDLQDSADVEQCVQGMDYVLHVGAFVSPAADYHPEQAMRINYGGTLNLIRAIKKQPDPKAVKFVYIGTVAETGDRMSPIHWGRAGDPLKPSVHDYYAISKIAAERAVIESGLTFVSMRQTGILSLSEFTNNDPIAFHQPLNNVLEWVTDYESADLMFNVCEADVSPDFWGHIYNIGGGQDFRVTNYELMSRMYARVGIQDIRQCFEANWYATNNFHGQWYLDSDKLDGFLHFRSRTMEGFLQYYGTKMTEMNLAWGGIGSGTPPDFDAMARSMKTEVNFPMVLRDNGPMNWLVNNRRDRFDPFFLSVAHWADIPGWDRFEIFRPAGREGAVRLDHGYDEGKPASSLTLDDVSRAAEFRGGKCLSASMEQGDWDTPLDFTCAFGHRFTASPRLMLEGGHFCPDCVRESWNYQARAKREPFFAQVWYPLHAEDEPERAYPLAVNDLIVTNCENH